MITPKRGEVWFVAWAVIKIMIGVDCVFQADGTIQVRRVEVDGRWQSVGQGRQWRDMDGRHLLIMLPDNQTRELLLRVDTLTWQLIPARPSPQLV
jgi:hypothetical protein